MYLYICDLWLYREYYSTKFINIEIHSMLLTGKVPIVLWCAYSNVKTRNQIQKEFSELIHFIMKINFLLACILNYINMHDWKCGLVTCNKEVSTTTEKACKTAPSKPLSIIIYEEDNCADIRLPTFLQNDKVAKFFNCPHSPCNSILFKHTC